MKLAPYGSARPANTPTSGIVPRAIGHMAAIGLSCLHWTGGVIDGEIDAPVVGNLRILVVSEPVLMEVLAGARSAENPQILESVLTSFHWTPIEPAADFGPRRPSSESVDRRASPSLAQSTV